MIRQILKIGIFTIGLTIILNSCGLQKEVVYRLDNQPKVDVDLPLDYCNLYFNVINRIPSFKKLTDEIDQMFEN